MTGLVNKQRAVAPRAAILLPVAFLFHVLEEWYWDLPAWTLNAPGVEVTPERFVLINSTAILLFGIGTMATLYVPGFSWFAASLAALFGLNGVVHLLATLGTGSYSPGTVTGLLLYVPLSVVVLRSSSARLSRGVFAGSIAFGVMIQVLAYFLARS